MSTNASKRSILFAVTATQFAVPFMLSSVGVALPTIGRHFAAGAVALSLVESIYIGVTAMFLLPLGRWSDMVGHGPIFRIGQIIFCLATLTLAVAWNIQSFIAIRVVQGLGGAMMVSTGLALLSSSFPREERGRAMGISIAGIYLGISAGPYLGGLLTTAFGWQSVFLAGTPPLLLALFLSWRAMPLRPVRIEGERFDMPGAILCMAALGSLVGGSAAFATLAGKLVVVAGLVLLAFFVFWEFKADQPLLDIRLFAKNRDFAQGNGLQFLVYAASFGITFLMSLYLQCGQGMSAHKAGTLLVIQPLIQAVLTPFFGRLADRYPPERFTNVGMILITASLALAFTFDKNTPLPLFVVMLSSMGLGISLFSAPNMSIIMDSVPAKHYGLASATTGCMRTTGMTLSLVLVSLALAHFLGHQEVTAATFDLYIKGMRLVVGCFIAMCALATTISLYLLWKHRRGGKEATL